MTTTELQRYLHKHIPLSQAMQVTVERIDEDSVMLGAPLAPNINHRETVFGGSASAVATLAAWSLLHTRLQNAGLSRRLVIQRQTMHFDLPITGDFTARSFISPTSDWEKFVHSLARKGRARITVSAVVEHGGNSVARLEGNFVALSSPDDPDGMLASR